MKHGDTQHYAHNPGGMPPEVDAHSSPGEPNIDEYEEWVDSWFWREWDRLNEDAMDEAWEHYLDNRKPGELDNSRPEVQT